MAGLGSCFTNCLNPLKQATSCLSERPANTSSIQLRFTAWLSLGISEPSASCSHLRLLYNSGRVALSKTQVGADLGLHHLGNPRASTPSGQLQTTPEHHHPAPVQLVLPGAWSAEGGGQWSQPIFAVDRPGKIPPIDLPTATKSQLQEEGVHSPHEGCTLSAQLG